ncbi:MAG TPA: hypothetical protein VFZ65_22470 [Planctomycetota bacterium]|nr:hypothetical protein [Planctomycetota bacterium]
MFRSLRSVLVVAAVAAPLYLGTGNTLRAQTGERSRWDQVTLGNSDLGVDVIGWARTRNTGTERRVDEAAWIQLRLFGSSIELERIAATAIRNGSSFFGSAGLRRGEMTVRNDSLSNSGTLSYQSSASVFPSNRYATFYIFGVPITVGVNMGHTGVMNMSLLNWTNSNASVLSGSMDSYAWGWASIGIGVPGLQGGAQVAIQIGHQRFDGVLGAYTNYINTSYLGYSMTPIRLLLRLFLQITFLTGYLNVADATIGERVLDPFMP